MTRCSAFGPLSKRPSIAASAAGWCVGDELGLAVAGRERDQHARDQAGDDADAQERARVLDVRPRSA